MEGIGRFFVGGKFVGVSKGGGASGKGEGVTGWAVGFVIGYCDLFPKFLEYVSGTVICFPNFWSI